MATGVRNRDAETTTSWSNYRYAATATSETKHENQQKNGGLFQLLD